MREGIDARRAATLVTAVFVAAGAACGCSSSTSSGSGGGGGGAMSLGGTSGAGSGGAPSCVPSTTSGTDLQGDWCNHNALSGPLCVGPHSVFLSFVTSASGVSVEFCFGYGQQCSTFPCTVSGANITCNAEPGRDIELKQSGSHLVGEITGCTSCDGEPCLCDFPIDVCKV